MKRLHAGEEFESAFLQDDVEGWAGFDLYQLKNGSRERVARITFWDAQGQFFIETFGGDVPLTAIEELILEARAKIRAP